MYSVMYIYIDGYVDVTEKKHTKPQTSFFQYLFHNKAFMYEKTNAITVQLFCKPFGDDHLHTVPRKDNGGSTFNIGPSLKSMLFFWL